MCQKEFRKKDPWKENRRRMTYGGMIHEEEPMEERTTEEEPAEHGSTEERSAEEKYMKKTGNGKILDETISHGIILDK